MQPFCAAVGSLWSWYQMLVCSLCWYRQCLLLSEQHLQHVSAAVTPQFNSFPASSSQLAITEPIKLHIFLSKGFQGASELRSGQNEGKRSVFSRNWRSQGASIVWNFKPCCWTSQWAPAQSVCPLPPPPPVLSLHEDQETRLDINTKLALQHDEECSDLLEQRMRTKGEHCVQKVLPHKRTLTQPEMNPHTSVFLLCFLLYRPNHRPLAHRLLLMKPETPSRWKTDACIQS